MMKRLIALLLAALCLSIALAETVQDADLIRIVQTELNRAGYSCGTPDGVPGKKTAAAVRAFRSANGLPDGDGIDSDVIRALGILDIADVKDYLGLTEAEIEAVEGIQKDDAGWYLEAPLGGKAVFSVLDGKCWCVAVMGYGYSLYGLTPLQEKETVIRAAAAKGIALKESKTETAVLQARMNSGARLQLVLSGGKVAGIMLMNDL